MYTAHRFPSTLTQAHPGTPPFRRARPFDQHNGAGGDGPRIADVRRAPGELQHAEHEDAAEGAVQFVRALDAKQYGHSLSGWFAQREKSVKMREKVGEWVAQ